MVDTSSQHVRLAFLPSKAVGAVHLDTVRRQHYVVTGQGIRKVETAIGQAVTSGYLALQRRHERALKKRTVVIIILVITAVAVGVFK